MAEPLPSRFLGPAVIALGLIAAGLGIISLLKSEPRLLGGGAIALGISAAVLQWPIVIASAIIFLLGLSVLISFLGG